MSNMKLTSRNQSLYLGCIENTYLGYSNDENIRYKAASGGIISTLIFNLLDKKKIDGALVCREIMKGDKISFEVKIVTKPDEILEFGGSVYFDVPILSNINLIRNFKGKLAVVGLPCQLRLLSEICHRDKEISKKIVLKIGLFCGHNSRRELLLEVLRKKKIQEKDVKKVIFRRGHWRGKMHIYLKNGEVKIFPFQHFSIYQNLHFDSLKKCIYCLDHTAEFSDISCGDAWLTYLKKDPIKHSVIIARNENGDDILKELRREGTIYLMKIEPEIVFKSQKRALIYHKSIEARSRIGKLLGFNIRYPTEYENTSRWNDYLAAVIVLSNIKVSYNNRLRRLIFLVPRKIFYLYFVLFKVLTNF